MRLAWAPVALVLASCVTHARGAEPDVTVAGTVLHVHDDSAVDGPIVLMIESAPGKTVDLHMGSVFISPSPDARRRETFALVRRTQVGDRVRAHGRWMDAK